MQAVLLLAGVVALGACGSDEIVISGSSTVEPISIKVAEAFSEIRPDVNIAVTGPGTGDGFQAFCEGDTAISNASRTIKDEEIATCDGNNIEYVELKVAYDGIAVMTNPANDAVDCLNFNDLYSLIGVEAQGIKSWSEASTVAGELGSTTALPELGLKVVGPGPESGTYDSFVEIVFEESAEIREHEGVIGEGEGSSTRSDYNAAADDNAIIEGIKADKGALGWVGFAYAQENTGDVQEIQVDGGDGCSSPTAQAIADGAYPVSRGLYVYVNATMARANEALREYIDLYLGDAYEDSVTRAFGDSGYVVLPADQLAETTSLWDAAVQRNG